MRPSWDEYFMAMAVFVSSRSSCRHVRAGSVIVLDNRIIGTGYNGSPPGVKENCLDEFCRKEKREEQGYGDKYNTGNCIGVHAEMNALANLTRNIHQGAVLYTTVFPCPSCVKNLLAYHIKRIVYLKTYDKGETDLSMEMLREAGVELFRISLSAERLNQIIFDRKVTKFNVF